MSVLAHLIKWAVGLAPPEVWTTMAERDCLARHAAGRRRVAEIGVWHGGTSDRLRAAMAADGTFYAIDPYEKGRLGFSIPRVVGCREVECVRNGRVIWVRKAGADAARSPEIRAGGPFDFVFVDDAQTYEMLRVEWGRIRGSARRAPSLTRRRCSRWPSGCVCCSRICRKAYA